MEHDTLNLKNHIFRVGQFEKVSKEAYDKIVKNFQKTYSDIGLVCPDFIPYDEIKQPVRKTNGSAGYDIHMTHDVKLFYGSSVIVPTFIRCKIDTGWQLQLYPRSGLGFKYGIRLANTVGIIDQDYYFSASDGNDNEGHIMVKIVNSGNRAVKLKMHDRFCQAVFIPFGITYDDDQHDKEIRSGGLGSTKMN